MSFSNSNINIEELPTVGAINLQRISKSFLKVIAFNRLIFYFILVGLSIGLKFLIREDVFQKYYWYGILALLIFFLVDFVIAILAFKRRKYALREHDVIYSKGLIVYYRITIPLNRVQHVEVSQSWLERYLKLASLKIYTAGESGGDLRIRGLENETAQSMNAYISSRINA